MLVDSHCHLNFPELSENLTDVLALMQENQVGHALVVSVSQDSLNPIIAMVEKYAHLFGSIGIHPDGIDSKEFSLPELIALSAHAKIVAIGETGLDYHWSQGDMDWQKNRFITHILASNHTKLPLIIHTRDAGMDTLDIMQAEQAQSAVIHCFTESMDFAKKALDLGYYISFSGIVTFKNAQSIQEVCRYVPDDRILIETDAPYLAPVPMRGKTNQPAYVRHTANFVAQLRETSLEHLAQITSDNFFKLFTKATRIDRSVLDHESY